MLNIFPVTTPAHGCDLAFIFRNTDKVFKNSPESRIEQQAIQEGAGASPPVGNSSHVADNSHVNDLMVAVPPYTVSDTGREQANHSRSGNRVIATPTKDQAAKTPPSKERHPPNTPRRRHRRPGNKDSFHCATGATGGAPGPPPPGGTGRG